MQQRAFMRPGLCALALVGATACGGADTPRTATPGPAPDAPAAAPGQPLPEPPPATGLASLSCPATRPAPRPLPRVTTAHETLAYWEQVLGERFDLDEALLSADDIANANASLAVPRPSYYPPRDLLEPMPADDVRAKVQGRMDWLRDKLASGDYRPAPAVEAALQIPSYDVSVDLRVATAAVQLYCAPTPEPLRAPDSIDPRIDMNRCSGLRAQEPVAVLATWPNGMMLAQSALSWGFLPADAPLSPTIPPRLAAAFVRGPFAVVPDGAPDLGVPPRSRVPRAAGNPKKQQKKTRKKTKTKRDQLVAATRDGFETFSASAVESRADDQPFTRRAVLREAFAHLGTPYGYGGKDGGLDCSRFLNEVFAAFGIALPRHSSWQPKAASFSIDVAGIPRTDKLGLLDAAQQRGVVLLQMSGHIMLYLGRDDTGRPMAIHAFAHYLEPCASGDGETAVLADRIEVSDLMLGDGTSKTAFLDRLENLAVIGQAPGAALAGAASERPAAPVQRPSKAQCRRARGSRLFVGPRLPNSGERLRAVAHMPSDGGPETLALFDPRGRRVDADVVRTGGPPYGFIATVDDPAVGEWTIALGEGSAIRSCRTVRVLPRKRAQILHNRRRARAAAAAAAAARERAEQDAAASEIGASEVLARSSDGADTAAGAAGAGPPPPAPDAVWASQRDWDRAYEDLYAVFVERLFDYPVDEDRTWPNLHALLRDRDRNILHGYLGDEEEAALELVPDCADLPYTLRAYFSWKLGLPFGVHDCSRARDGRAPRCERSRDNGMARSELPKSPTSDGAAFEEFVNRVLRRTVHSSSGRTAPEDEASDFYPVALTRRSLRPGTVFNDPYGHLIVVADWLPQGASGYGALIGADAQPDGTIGRRRFWRGSFLFRPETANGGAGFKAFRPWVRDPATGALQLASNEELDHRRYRRGPRRSTQQYEGSVADFYDRMRALINPRPLDPKARMLSLVQALEEQVARRVVSVQNGEDFMKERQFAAIDMPTGARIFQTSGPWEEYSTPSRDWRLLIAIDTVTDFPRSVERNPAQFGLAPSQGKDQAAALGQALDAELRRRTFEYVRSDGSRHTLSLADVVARARAMEMAYNPNDCVELRWAAPEGTPERSTCRRSAPDDQRAKMREYRPWFSDRSRPPS